MVQIPSTLERALRLLREFIEQNRWATIWSHPSFDIPVLNNAYKSLNQETPIYFRLVRDIRTLIDLSGYDITWKEGVDPKNHRVIDNCIYQVEYCVEATRKLKGDI